MKNYKIIALFGKSGAGKDTILKELCQPEFLEKYNLKPIISCTTRKPRDYEIHGKDYYFLTGEEFKNEILSGNMLEATEFIEQFYGTRASDLDEDKINIGVFNIDGILNLRTVNEIEVIPVFIDCDAKERLIRCLNREEHPNVNEVIRRYQADEKDFSEIPFAYIAYDNSNDNYNYPGAWAKELEEELLNKVWAVLYCG